ncbi:putative restriction and modification system specificity protein [Weissella oryzae SG25]|uniref:Putative restriction and modification system specificity protein n=2 Tax=Weissella TaxID=46255 RepID=A0A069CRC6_WEIOS|nr:putative restriction and modification system specificity protein [Weissella oryzae SG25]
MDKGFPFVNLQDIFGKTVLDCSDDFGLAESTEKQRLDYNLLAGDILFIRSSVKPSGVGETALVPMNLINTTYSGFIIRMRFNVSFDNDFKRFALTSKDIRNQIMARATSSANTNINQDSLALIRLSYPSIQEQQKIGNFFAKLDHLITLHQRKSK